MISQGCVAQLSPALVIICKRRPLDRIVQLFFKKKYLTSKSRIKLVTEIKKALSLLNKPQLKNGVIFHLFLLREKNTLYHVSFLACFFLFC